jgi:transposase-like protein
MAHGEKAVVWRERLRRFARSGLTVARFCQDEGVSEPSFYQWRKRLAESAAGDSSRQIRPAFEPVAVTPTPVRSTAGGVSIELSGGARIELPAEHVELVQAVVRELLRAESETGDAAGDGRC